MNPFHYAFKVKDLPSTRSFYLDLMGCEPGRSTDTWQDFSFYGHQMSAHISDHLPELDYCGHVDGKAVPLPHFGCLLTLDQFTELQQRLENAKVDFVIEPYLRYVGQPGEQWTMFFLDHSGNPIEVKAFTNPDEVFAS